MSIERRIEDLEKALGHTGEAGEHNPERERLLEQAQETHRRAWEKALAEEAEGDPRRRIALEDLEAYVRTRHQERS